MDTNSNTAMQYFSMANQHRETYTTTAGDFADSEELNQHIRKAMEMKEEFCGGLGTNPFSQQKSASVIEATSQKVKLPLQAQAVSSGGWPLSAPAIIPPFQKTGVDGAMFC